MDGACGRVLQRLGETSRPTRPKTRSRSSLPVQIAKRPARLGNRHDELGPAPLHRQSARSVAASRRRSRRPMSGSARSGRTSCDSGGAPAMCDELILERARPQARGGVADDTRATRRKSRAFCHQHSGHVVLTFRMAAAPAMGGNAVTPPSAERPQRRPRGADGTMTAVWVAPFPAYRSTVRASTRLPGRRFGAAADLSPPRRG